MFQVSLFQCYYLWFEYFVLSFLNTTNVHETTWSLDTIFSYLCLFSLHSVSFLLLIMTWGQRCLRQHPFGPLCFFFMHLFQIPHIIDNIMHLSFFCLLYLSYYLMFFFQFPQVFNFLIVLKFLWYRHLTTLVRLIPSYQKVFNHILNEIDFLVSSSESLLSIFL